MEATELANGESHEPGTVKGSGIQGTRSQPSTRFG